MSAAAGYSLRRRLLAWVLSASVAVWLLSLGIIVGVAWRESGEMFDEALQESARLALALGAELPAVGTPSGRLRNDDGEPPKLKLKLYYQLVAGEQVLRRAEGAPSEPFVRNFRKDGGHVDTRIDGRAWRVYVRRDPVSGLQAQVGQPLAERLELLEEMAEKLAWPALGLLAVLGSLSWFLISRLLVPLERTAAGIAAKSPQDLSPVLAPQQPRELQPVIDALNALLARLSDALDAERRFTADAAHELRTPLAALRMRVQLIERRLGLPAAELQQLRADVDRCTALIHSLLALARLDPGHDALACETVDLARLFAGLDRSATQARGMQLQCDARAPQLQAQPALLASALRNLLDNAARYGRDGGEIRIESLPLAQGGVRIAVRDDGPGVPEAERARLGERFFRVLGSGASGNGLGLSIVARIAALHGATLRFDEGLHGRGLSAMLDFPPRNDLGCAAASGPPHLRPVQ